ncbi:MAG: ankyrin repeat domain-containing protein, partial [Verrucomicrobia bacterium]|nr:ankyrin repeat domain-containing protein [Verrucomicrobiota bacterium]
MINPPLFSAASNGNVDECRRLIEEGATVNIVCGKNRWLPI